MTAVAIAGGSRSAPALRTVVAIDVAGLPREEVEGLLGLIRRAGLRPELGAEVHRVPTPDGLPEVVLAGDAAYLRDGDGALLAELPEREAELVELLLRRLRDGRAAIASREQLVAALRAFAPGVWSEVSPEVIGLVYARAREALKWTPWPLEDRRGVYGFDMTALRPDGGDRSHRAGRGGRP